MGRYLGPSGDDYLVHVPCLGVLCSVSWIWFFIGCSDVVEVSLLTCFCTTSDA